MAVETYEYIVSGSVAGQFVQNVFHLNVDNTTASPPFTVAEGILNKFDAASQFNAKWLDCCPEGYIISSIRCRQVLATGGPTAIRLGAALNYSSGTRTGDPSSSVLSPLIIWLTTLRPSKTGRTFIPAVSEADIDNNALVAGLVTACTTFINYWIANITLASPALTVNGAIFRRAIHASDDIAYGRVSPVIGVQRRREHPV